VHLRDHLKELADVRLRELEGDLVARVAGPYQVLVVLVLADELVRHVPPDDLEQAGPLGQVLLHLRVQRLQAFLDLLGRELLDDLSQVVRGQVQLVRDVLGLVAALDLGVHLLEEVVQLFQGPAEVLLDVAGLVEDVLVAGVVGRLLEPVDAPQNVCKQQNQSNQPAFQGLTRLGVTHGASGGSSGSG